jgi:hypothetical protein
MYLDLCRICGSLAAAAPAADDGCQNKEYARNTQGTQRELTKNKDDEQCKKPGRERRPERALFIYNFERRTRARDASRTVPSLGIAAALNSLLTGIPQHQSTPT